MNVINNGIMAKPTHPPAFHSEASTDGKQGINLEWSNVTVMHKNNFWMVLEDCVALYEPDCHFISGASLHRVLPHSLILGCVHACLVVQYYIIFA